MLRLSHVILILWAVSAMAQTPDGTAWPGPLDVLPYADQSEPLPLRLNDTTGLYVGFISPSVVTPIEISTATAANPMVLTLAATVPTSIKVGDTVRISGATGSGCSGMNATQTVSAVSTSTVTIAFNGTGCTYGAGSADLYAGIYWELPPTDGTIGQCISLTAAYVLGWATCSGGSGANTTLSNLTSPTSINQDLLSSANKTKDLGSSSNFWQEVWSAQSISEVFTLYSGSPVQSWVYDTGTSTSIFQNILGQCLFKMPNSGSNVTCRTLNPDVNNNYDLGTTSLRYRTAYVVDLNISGTCTGCTSGANTTLSNLTSPTAINQHLIPSGSRDLGTTSAPWNFGYGLSLFTEDLNVANPGGSFASKWHITSANVAGTQHFYVLDTASATRLDYSTASSGTLTVTGNVNASNSVFTGSMTSATVGLTGSGTVLSTSLANFAVTSAGYVQGATFQGTASTTTAAFTNLLGSFTADGNGKVTLSELAGTFPMSGTETVSGSLTIKSTSTPGNFYNRVVTDDPVTPTLSCSGVTDGWTALVWDTATLYWAACYGGTRYKSAFVTY